MLWLSSGTQLIVLGEDVARNVGHVPLEAPVRIITMSFEGLMLRLPFFGCCSVMLRVRIWRG